MRRKTIIFIQATATLLGTIMGAGILGIPYSIKDVGFGPGVCLMIGIAVMMTILELMYAELILRTRSDHEVPGYSGVYLGAPAKKIAVALGLMGGYGALLAYIIGEGEVFKAILGGSEVMWSVLFFMIAGSIIYSGLNMIKKIEVVFIGMIFSVVILMAFVSLPYLHLEYLTSWSFDHFFQPYGVLLFALTGVIAIPQVHKEIIGMEKDFPKIIIAANTFAVIIYILFSFVVLGVSGPSVTPVATVGLGQFVGPGGSLLGNVIAAFAMSTSFLTIGFAIRRMFETDYHFKKLHALIATITIPFTLFIVGARNFIGVLYIVGGVILGLQNIIIIFSFWKARINGSRRPEFSIGVLGLIGGALMMIFIVGALYSIKF